LVSYPYLISQIFHEIIFLSIKNFKSIPLTLFTMSAPLKPSSAQLEVTLKAKKLLGDTKSDVHFTSFLEKNDNYEILINNWAYYSSVRNDNELIELSELLDKILQRVQFLEQIDLYRVIALHLIKSMNHIYPIFETLKPTLISPILRLLTHIVEFNEGSLVTEFSEAFNFKNEHLTELLEPSTKRKYVDFKSTTRYNMIQFYIQLLSNASSHLRKDLLLTNKYIFNRLLKHLELDDDEVVKDFVEFLQDYVVHEESFKKSTKLQIINEPVLSVLAKLLDRDENVYEFLRSFAKGVTFHDDKVWACELGENTLKSGGAEVKFEGHSFKLYNKMIYYLATQLKPWKDAKQLALFIELASQNYEIFLPFQYFVSTHIGNFSPKLTSTAIGFTLMLTKMSYLKPPKIPETATYNTNAESLSLHIVPLLTTKQSLIRGLTDPSNFINYLTLQLLNSIFHKYSTVFGQLSSSNLLVDFSDLSNTIIERIPDLSTILGCFKAIDPDNVDELYLLALTMTLEGYLKFFPQITGEFAVSLPQELYLPLVGSSTPNVAILDHYLTLQTLLDSSFSLKWWNPIASNDHSLFTHLIRLSSTSERVGHVLETLTLNHIVFQDSRSDSSTIKINPIYPLLKTVSRLTDQVCKLLDETIARSIKTPYKYIDLSFSVTKRQISPFIVTLLEQWKFVKIPSEETFTWLYTFLNYLVVNGEDPSVLEYLMTHFNVPFGKWLKRKKYYIDDSSPGSRVLLNNMKGDFQIPPPKNDFDVVQFFYKISNLEKTSPKVNESIVLIFNKLETYLLDNPQSLERITSRKFWGPLFVSEKPLEWQLFVSFLVNELFQNFCTKNNAHLFQEYGNRIASLMPEAKDNVLVKLVTSALWSVDKDTLLSFLTPFSEKGRHEIVFAILDELSSREIQLPFEILLLLVNEHYESHIISFIGSIKLDKSQYVALLTKSISFHCKEITRKLIIYSSSLALSQVDQLPLSDKIFLGSMLNDREFADTVIEESFHMFEKSKSLHFFDSKIDVIDFLNLFNHGTPSIERDRIVLLKALDNKKFKSTENYIFSEAFASFAYRSEVNLKEMQTWLVNSFLYITKKVAENDTLGENFLAFLTSFQGLFRKWNVWKFIQPSILNTQLQVILQHKQWVNNKNLLKYCVLLISAGDKDSAIEGLKLLQIFTNNELIELSNLTGDEESKYYSSLILYKLISLDLKTASTNVSGLLEQLLTYYQGSLRPSDLFIKVILSDLESVMGKSWCILVDTWVYLQEFSYEQDYSPLISKGEKDTVLTLDKKVVEESVENFDPEMYHSIFSLKNISDYEEFYNTRILLCKRASVDPDRIIYDPEVFNLLLLSNPELFKDDDTIEVKNIVESGILQYVVLSLTIDEASCNRIALTILNAIYTSLSDDIELLENKKEGEKLPRKVYPFKDRYLFKLYLGKILASFLNFGEDRPSSFIIGVISQFVPVLADPTHPVFEKAYRYLLIGPWFVSTEIPLFKSISLLKLDEYHKLSVDEQKLYYDQLTWLLTSYRYSMTLDDDNLRMLSLSGFFPWIMNLMNSPYISSSIHLQIQEFISKVLRLTTTNENLVTRHGILSWLEALQYTLRKESGKNTEEDLVNKFNSINVSQLGLQLDLTVTKRTKHWTYDNWNTAIKRICTSFLP